MRRFLEMVLREDLKQRRTYKVLQLLGKWTENISSRCGEGWAFVEKHRNENKEPFVFKLCQKHFHWFWQPFVGKVLTNPMLSLTKRDERPKKRRGAGVQWSHWWGTTARNCTETTPGGVSSEVNDICYPQSRSPRDFFFGVWKLWNLKYCLFFILIGEWQKGPHRISSSHSNSLHSK